MSQSSTSVLGTIIKEKLTYQKLSERERPLKTGIGGLDKYLEGGITPGLIVLGAGPGQGKSTIALQLAEHVSEKENTPVLYFSLEMTEDRIAAKAITMENFRNAKDEGFPVDSFRSGTEAKEKFFTASELFNPEKLETLTEDKRRQLDAAGMRVGENKNLHVIDRPYCAREIVEKVKVFINEQQSRINSGEKIARRPLVIIDYLQILPLDPNARGSFTDKQQVEMNLKVLRELVLLDIAVILISSLKRGNYSGKGTGPMRMDSFKESGGIEYSADVLLGLQFSACYHKNGCNPDDEKKKYPRDMELVILKQRYGPTDVGVPLRYYAEFDYFEEQPVEKPASEQPEKTEKRPDASPEMAGSAAEVQMPEAVEKIAEDSHPHSLEPSEASREQVRVAYMNNTKLATEIRNGHRESGKTYKCNVAGRGKEPVLTEYKINGELTHYDCDVADAVYSLYLNGHKAFTLRQLLHALTGDKTQTLTEQKKKELEKSLENIMSASIRIDCTREMVELYKKPELVNNQKKVIYKGKFLRAELKEGKYHIQGENAMPLYHYAELKGQMIAFPERLLAMRPGGGTKIPDNRENIQIKRYLIRRLERIRHNGASAGGHLQKVNYYNNKAGAHSGMLAAFGIKRGDSEEPARWNSKLEQIHKSVTGMLDCFVQHGYITGYKAVGSDGVELLTKVNNPFQLK